MRLIATTIWPRVGWFLLLAVPFSACGGDGPANPVVATPELPGPTDTPAPPDPAAPDPAAPDPGSTPPPQPPGDPAAPPTHEGIPFGPAHIPKEVFPEYSGTIYTPSTTNQLVHALQEARRSSTRIFISFSGNGTASGDANGFNFEKWKARVDRFKDVDLQSYIDDGTILGHFIMDEPDDKANWNGHLVPLPEIERMAAYSKEVWPTMITMIRAWPAFLEGYKYPHLDAVRIQYSDRFGNIDSFIPANVNRAKALDLALVGGLNVINGGSKNSGIPGRRENKFAMNASELRSWGSRFLAEPYICAFVLYEYDEPYLARSDIRDALADLAKIARDRSKKECRL